MSHLEGFLQASLTEDTAEQTTPSLYHVETTFNVHCKIAITVSTFEMVFEGHISNGLLRLSWIYYSARSCHTLIALRRPPYR